MIESIETGYEPKFDFPEWHGAPALPWLLASVPRTGSTFVSHLLWETGCLGAPLEYCNFEPAGPQGLANSDPAAQRALWRRALAHRTSPNGVFGLKAFPLQMEHLQQVNPALTAEVMRTVLGAPGGTRVVQLRRRDRTAHAMSYARAMLSGVWRKEQEREGAVEPQFSQTALDRALALVDEQEGAWAQMFVALRITPMVLWYEEAVADPQSAVLQVADLLGVWLDPEARVAVPRIERQARADDSWQNAIG